MNLGAGSATTGVEVDPRRPPSSGIGECITASNRKVEPSRPTRADPVPDASDRRKWEIELCGGRTCQPTSCFAMSGRWWIVSHGSWMIALDDSARTYSPTRLALFATVEATTPQCEPPSYEAFPRFLGGEARCFVCGD